MPYAAHNRRALTANPRSRKIPASTSGPHVAAGTPPDQNPNRSWESTAASPATSEASPLVTVMIQRAPTTNVPAPRRLIAPGATAGLATEVLVRAADPRLPA